MKQKKFYTEEEILNEYIGKEGTIKRNEFDSNIQSFLIGEAIKKARLAQNMTQEELGTLIGVQRAQISKIENGKNLTMNTISRIFQAMNIKATLELGTLGKVALW